MSFVLESGRARVAVDAARGGRIGSLRVDGLELLVSRGPDPLRWGCYPMAPWAGRVREGRFSFAGRDYSVPLSLPPHAIHGTTHRLSWAEDGPGRLAVALGPEWPFAGRAVQEFVLDDQALALRLEVHASDRPFPASAGWHPWFRRRLERGAPAELDLPAAVMYLRDRDGIPTGERVSPTPGPWDDCFSDLSRAPVLSWPGALRLELDSSCTHWVVYDEPEHAICVEPQSGPPDALNLSPFVVEPGRPLIVETRLRWTR